MDWLLYSTAKKLKEFEKMRQVYESNRNNSNQLDNAFQELYNNLFAKELELAKLRAEDNSSSEKGISMDFSYIYM